MKAIRRAKSDSGLRVLGRLSNRNAKAELSNDTQSHALRKSRIYQLLISIALFTCPSLGSGSAQTQEAAPAKVPVEFTVQTGHTAEIQGLEYAAAPGLGH